MGVAPWQTTQAEMPLFHNSPGPRKWRRQATAPVVMPRFHNSPGPRKWRRQAMAPVVTMTASASTVVELERTLKGLEGSAVNSIGAVEHHGTNAGPSGGGTIEEARGALIELDEVVVGEDAAKSLSNGATEVAEGEEESGQSERRQRGLEH